MNLEALAVHNCRTRLIIFLLGDPHLLEGGKRCQDGASNPDRIFTLWGSNDLDLHGWWSERSNFLLHAVSNTWVHGGTTRKHSVGIQIFTDVNITLHDGIVGGFMDASRFHAKEGWLKHSLWAAEALISNGDDLPIRKLIALFKAGAGCRCGHFLLKVKSNIAQFLLDVTDNLTLGSGGEGVASLSQDLHKVVSEISASQIKTQDSMGQSIAFIDGDSVAYTITTIHDNTSGTTRGVQRQYSLDGNIHGWGVESLKHNLKIKRQEMVIQLNLNKEMWFLLF